MNTGGAAPLETVSPAESRRRDDAPSSTLMKPTFLGIGSARCGTTWLHRVLAEHPEIQMSTPKQLDFFDKNIVRHDLAWYYAHFDPPHGQTARPVRGEISPRNAALPTELIQMAKRTAPDARLVLLIRHPVDRIWSNAMHELGFRRGEEAKRIPMWRLHQYCQSPRTTVYSDYAMMIRRWTAVFGEERLLVERFESIRTEPAELLRRILRHIGADETWSPAPSLLTEKVHSIAQLVASASSMPLELRAGVSKQWIEPMKDLDALLDGRVTDWVDDLVRESERSATRFRFAARSVVVSAPERLAYRFVRRRRVNRALRHWKNEWTSSDVAATPRSAPVATDVSDQEAA